MFLGEAVGSWLLVFMCIRSVSWMGSKKRRYEKILRFLRFVVAITAFYPDLWGAGFIGVC